MLLPGEEIPSTGLVLLEQLVKEISCSDCGEVVQGPSLQCRKGHLYCRACRRENKCRVCQQTFIESPSLGLDRLLSLLRHPFLNAKYLSGILSHSLSV